MRLPILRFICSIPHIAVCLLVLAGGGCSTPDARERAQQQAVDVDKVIASLATNPPAPPAPGVRVKPLGVKIDQVWCVITAGSSADDTFRFSEPSMRTMVGGGVVKGTTDQALKFYQQGFRNFYLNAPFGQDTLVQGSTKHAKFTFFGALRGEPDSAWRKDFESSWRKITGLPGVKVVAYVGNPAADAEFLALIEGTPAQGTPKGENFKRALRMFRLALEPLKRAGIRIIAIDASESTPEDHWLGELLKIMADLMGFEVLIEPTPMKDHQWLVRFGTVRTTWFARNAYKWPGFLDPRYCKGTRIQIFDGHIFDPKFDGTDFQTWGGPWMNRCTDTGEAPAFPPHGQDLVGIGLVPAGASR